MASIKQVAMQFFEACETGKGWEGCKAYCKPNATFSAQAEPLADVRTLQAYADWMHGLHAQAALQAADFALSIWGIVSWSRRP